MYYFGFNHTICSTIMGPLSSHSLSTKLLQKLIKFISSRASSKQMPLVLIFFYFLSRSDFTDTLFLALMMVILSMIIEYKCYSDKEYWIWLFYKCQINGVPILSLFVLTLENQWTSRSLSFVLFFPFGKCEYNSAYSIRLLQSINNTPNISWFILSLLHILTDFIFLCKKE